MCLEGIGLQFVVNGQEFTVEWNMRVSSPAQNHRGICRLNGKGILWPTAYSGIPEVVFIQCAAIAVYGKSTMEFSSVFMQEVLHDIIE